MELSLNSLNEMMIVKKVEGPLTSRISEAIPSVNV